MGTVDQLMLHEAQNKDLEDLCLALLWVNRGDIQVLKGYKYHQQLLKSAIILI